MASGETGREAPVGDADLAAAQGTEHLVDGGRHHGGQSCLTTVIPGGSVGREGASAGTQHLDPRGERLDRHQHRLEGTRVTIRVVRDQLEPRAALLRLASALAMANSLGPGGCRAGKHPTGIQHGHRLGGGHAGGRHRPIRAPDHQHAGHRSRSHPASYTDWRRRPLDAALVVSTSLPLQGRTTPLSISSSTART